MYLTIYILYIYQKTTSYYYELQITRFNCNKLGTKFPIRNQNIAWYFRKNYLCIHITLMTAF